MHSFVVIDRFIRLIVVFSFGGGVITSDLLNMVY